MRHLVIHSDFEHFRNELLHVESLFNASSESIHKARNELRIADLGEYRVVIKAFRVPNKINQVVYGRFRSSKAAKSYTNALALQQRDVNTPTPVAYIEDQSFGLFKTSYYISLLEPYDFTIRKALHRKVRDYSAVIAAFTAFTYDLHVKGVWHEDYSPGNILVTCNEQGYRFALVDINRMTFMPIGFEKGCANFSKLWAKKEELELMAQEYARLWGRAFETTLETMQLHVDKVIERKALKKRFKS